MKWGTEPAAGEPKFACAGLALHQARNSATLRTEAGTAGPTANPKSKVQPRVTGERSATGS
jgi:hypothetical protein